MRSKWAIGWCTVFAVAVVLPRFAAAVTASSPKAEIERAVVRALPVWQGRKAQVIAYLDLTRPFVTTAPWALVVAQAAGPVSVPEWTDHGPITVCFMGGFHPEYPQCTGSYWQGSEGMAWFVQPYSARPPRVVYADRNKMRPLLLVQTCTTPGINGSCSIRSSLYRYVGSLDQFRRVFVHDSDGSNNNQAARFVEHGPLQGDVIVDYPTRHAPYTYWIEVYVPGKSGQYVRILRYRGRTGYGDRNPLAVADSEMPELLKRLGL